MSALIYLQDLSQLEAAYSREHATTIRSNCDTQVYYRPTDNLTAKYVTDRAGKTSVRWLNVASTVSETHTSATASWTWKDRELITVSELMQLPEGRTIAFVGNLLLVVAERVDYRWFKAEVAELERLNRQPPRLTRPSQPAMRYAESEPALPPAAPALRSSPEPSETRSQAPKALDVAVAPTPEPSERKKRRRSHKREAEAAEQGTQKAPGSENDPGMRATYPSSLEAAVAAFRDQGGDVSKINPCAAAVTGGGMPYRVYSDGRSELAVCEVGGRSLYFAATLEELGLELP